MAKELTLTIPGTEESKTYNSDTDIKTISDWSDTENDEPKKYLYIIKKGLSTLPALYIKLDECPAPVSTRHTIEELT